MPRGVAIPEVRQHLFTAAEQVIVRDGPARLSGRSVTAEAGVAIGLLHRHFADFDAFLADYAVDRAFLISAEAAALPERAGTGTVAGNLHDALLATPPAALLAPVRLLASRPELAERVRAILGERAAASTRSRAPSPPTSRPNGGSAAWPRPRTPPRWPSPSSESCTTSCSPPRTRPASEPASGTPSPRWSTAPPRPHR